MGEIGSAFVAVVKAAAAIPAAAGRSLTCKASGHVPHPEFRKICGRCGADLPR